MAGTFKILSALLSYPTQELVDAAPSFADILAADAILPRRERDGLQDLIGEFSEKDLYDLQERYVFLFDRTRSLSLHLFEHIHGESRDRGQALVNLAQLYEDHGLRIDAKELPDYLPLFLEFLSTQPAQQARDLLSQPLHIVAAVRQRLQKRKSAYAAVFGALEAAAQGKPEPAPLKELLDQPEDDPNDLAALDAIWEEEAVTFGPGDAGAVAPGGGCPAARNVLADMDPGVTAAQWPRPDSSGQ